MRFILASLLVLSGSAFAQDEGASASAGGIKAEFIHQAPDGKFEVTPRISLAGGELKYKNGNKYNLGGVGLDVRGEYGFSEMFSGYVSLGTASVTAERDNCPTGVVCRDTKSSGMIDPSVGVLGAIPAGPGHVRLGADLSMALEDHEIEDDGDQNMASGGTTLNVFAGYEMNIAQNVFGARLGYDLYQGDRDYNDKDITAPVKYKVSGGEDMNVDLYYEYWLNMVTIGGYFRYATSKESKAEANGVTVDLDDEAKATAFGVYVPVHFNDMITLLRKWNLEVSASKIALRPGTT